MIQLFTDRRSGVRMLVKYPTLSIVAVPISQSDVANGVRIVVRTTFGSLKGFETTRRYQSDCSPSSSERLDVLDRIGLEPEMFVHRARVTISAEHIQRQRSIAALAGPGLGRANQRPARAAAFGSVGDRPDADVSVPLGRKVVSNPLEQRESQARVARL